ncbi:adenine phosphoribosyltransferase [Pseudactinotalea suaedae]|uniref:adenine phosphoribosyltransferase n=1 Tax=Pseudactinotalea suaedae TaxID=1524924 RepID=UPI0012E1411F|nr:adenine phosphoribosyltransferase [Pseudactinotalea suaedae]
MSEVSVAEVVERAAAMIIERTRLTPDFPSPGVLFRDLTPVLCHADSLGVIAEAIAALGGDADLYAALEARGFLLGAAAAVAGGGGVLPLRKPGKLPGTGTEALLVQGYQLEYGTASLELQPADVGEGSRVVVVDDVLATGGTAAAAVELVRRAGGVVTAVVVAMELAALGGRSRIPADVPVHAITTID